MVCLPESGYISIYFYYLDSLSEILQFIAIATQPSGNFFIFIFMTATHRFPFPLSDLSFFFGFWVFFFVDFLANAFILCTCICIYVSGWISVGCWMGEAALYSDSDRLID